MQLLCLQTRKLSPQREVIGSRSSCSQDPSLPWPQLSALSTHYDDFARIMITTSSCVSTLQPLPSKCSASKGGNRRCKVLFALLIFKKLPAPVTFPNREDLLYTSLLKPTLSITALVCALTLPPSIQSLLDLLLGQLVSYLPYPCRPGLNPLCTLTVGEELGRFLGAPCGCAVYSVLCTVNLLPTPRVLSSR